MGSPKELAAVQDNAAICAKPHVLDRLLRLIAQLLVLLLWKSVQAIGVPVKKFLALNLWCGRSASKLSLWVHHQLVKGVGWSMAPAFPHNSRVERLSRNSLRFGDPRRVHVGLALAAVGLALYTAWAYIKEKYSAIAQRRKQLRALMGLSVSHAEWKQHAEQLDRLDEADRGQHSARVQREAKMFDKKLLKAKIEHLRHAKTSPNIREVLYALRIDMIRNIANVAKGSYDYYTKVPDPVHRYIREVKAILNQIARVDESVLTAAEKLNFFQETRHTYGRTALLLSGGGGLGTYHLGVVKALFEKQTLPRVLAGSSVGAIVAAIVCVRTDIELADQWTKLDQFDISFFNNSRAIQMAQHLLNKGSLQDCTAFVSRLRELVGDYTFLEAYEKTGRILNVTVTPADTNEPPRLLNYLTTPQVVIWSAVACSSAFPGLFPASLLMAKSTLGNLVELKGQSATDNLQRRWRDGSLELDLPVRTLGEMFNCNHFIVSQTNPHIVPLLNLKAYFSRAWGQMLEAEFRHRAQQLQWFLPEWVPSKWITLFTQPWEGDVTMILPASMWDLGKAITNPTTSELMRAVKVGELCTWEKLAAIQANCDIEATLDKCLAQLTNSVRGAPLRRGLGSRIPSWLHMPSVGLPAVATWGDGHMDAAAGGPEGQRAATEASRAAAAAAAASHWRFGDLPLPREEDLLADRSPGPASASASAAVGASSRMAGSSGCLSSLRPGGLSSGGRLQRIADVDSAINSASSEEFELPAPLRHNSSGSGGAGGAGSGSGGASHGGEPMSRTVSGSVPDDTGSQQGSEGDGASGSGSGEEVNMLRRAINASVAFSPIDCTDSSVGNGGSFMKLLFPLAQSSVALNRLAGHTDGSEGGPAVEQPEELLQY